MTTYIAYLDEFGHIGPFISRTDPTHNDSPVFGLAGYVMPAERVREFGSWFFQRKCDLLDFEIKRANVHPATWEKKGSSLYTTVNVKKYRELRAFTNRLFNKIERCGGFVFYVGVGKYLPVELHNANAMYSSILREAIKRIDSFCTDREGEADWFLMALDEHDQRAELITLAAKSMYGGDEPRRRLIEPPFHLESHRYQTIQAADWIAGLVGRLGAVWAEPDAYQDFMIFRTYFEERLKRVAKRSGIRTTPPSKGNDDG